MDHASQLHLQGLELLEAAQHAGLDAEVPSCPGWVVGKLVNHTSRALERTLLVVRGGLQGPPDKRDHRPLSRDGALFDQFRQILDETVEELGAADPRGVCWNFSGTDLTNAFWSRRMVHEVTVHRWDAQLAAGDPRPIDPESAVVGLDELVVTLLAPLARMTGTNLAASYHLHCTDVEGEWLVVFSDGEVVTTREHAKGDVAVRGPASPLFLWAWGRVVAGTEGLEACGDPDLVASWSTLGA